MNQETKSQKKFKQINISLESYLRLKEIMSNSIQKDFGKKPTFMIVFDFILNQIDEEKLITDIQKASIRPKDFNKHVYTKYCETNDEIDYNSFIKKVLSGEINTADLI